MCALWYCNCPIEGCKRHTAKAFKDEEWQGLMDRLQQHVDDAHPELEGHFWDDNRDWIEKNADRWQPDADSPLHCTASPRPPSEAGRERSRSRSIPRTPAEPSRTLSIPLRFVPSTPDPYNIPPLPHRRTVQHIPRTPRPATHGIEEAMHMYFLECERARWKFMRRIGRLSGDAPWPQ